MPGTAPAAREAASPALTLLVSRQRRPSPECHRPLGRKFLNCTVHPRPRGRSGVLRVPELVLPRFPDAAVKGGLPAAGNASWINSPSPDGSRPRRCTPGTTEFTAGLIPAGSEPWARDRSRGSPRPPPAFLGEAKSALLPKSPLETCPLLGCRGREGDGSCSLGVSDAAGAWGRGGCWVPPRGRDGGVLGRALQSPHRRQPPSSRLPPAPKAKTVGFGREPSPTPSGEGRTRCPAKVSSFGPFLPPGPGPTSTFPSTDPRSGAAFAIYFLEQALAISLSGSNTKNGAKPPSRDGRSNRILLIQDSLPKPHPTCR